MSAKPAFGRMHDRLFARLGEQAVLRGSEPCLVNIEYNVVVDQEIGDDKFVRSEFAAVVDIASILKRHNPLPGDSLGMLADDGIAIAKNYVIDAIVGDNGYMARCVLRG